MEGFKESSMFCKLAGGGTHQKHGLSCFGSPTPFDLLPFPSRPWSTNAAPIPPLGVSLSLARSAGLELHGNNRRCKEDDAMTQPVVLRVAAISL
jgi:hypothetical protein